VHSTIIYSASKLVALDPFLYTQPTLKSISLIPLRILNAYVLIAIEQGHRHVTDESHHQLARRTKSDRLTVCVCDFEKKLSKSSNNSPATNNVLHTVGRVFACLRAAVLIYFKGVLQNSNSVKMVVTGGY